MSWFAKCSVFPITLFALYTYADQAYIWEDERGVVHFSDFPQNSAAQSVALYEYQPSTPDVKFAESQPIATPQQQTEDTLTVPELHLNILSPIHNQTIRSNQGIIHIEANLNRVLQVSEHLQLIMDDAPYEAAKTQARWELKNIDRGTHTFMIQAVASGKVIALSELVTVHMHRASIN